MNTYHSFNHRLQPPVNEIRSRRNDHRCSVIPTTNDMAMRRNNGRSTMFDDYAILNDMAKRKNVYYNNVANNDNTGTMYQPPPEKNEILASLLDQASRGGGFNRFQSQFIHDEEDPAMYRDPSLFTVDRNKMAYKYQRNYGQSANPVDFYHSRDTMIQMCLEDHRDTPDQHMRLISSTNLPQTFQSAVLPPRHVANETLNSFFESLGD